MISLQCNPPIPTARIDAVFTQTIQLRDGDKQLGQATWHAAYPSEGVVQILELRINPALLRQGHARRLLRGVTDQARAHHRLHKVPLRRLWIGVGQKTQVIGRSFLTGEGFHHMGSSSGLMKDQDLMIYVKALD